MLEILSKFFNKPFLWTDKDAKLESCFLRSLLSHHQHWESILCTFWKLTLLGIAALWRQRCNPGLCCSEGWSLPTFLGLTLIPALAAGHQADVLILQACITKCNFLLLSFPWGVQGRLGGWGNSIERFHRLVHSFQAGGWWSQDPSPGSTIIVPCCEHVDLKIFLAAAVAGVYVEAGPRCLIFSSQCHHKIILRYSKAASVSVFESLTGPSRMIVLRGWMKVDVAVQAFLTPGMLRNP